MKKISLLILIASLFFVFNIFTKVTAQLPFPQAVRTCEKYSQNGSIKHNNEIFNILITLEKSKGDRCTYKEKIYQEKKYQMLTCSFTKSELPGIADSMERYNNVFSKEISQNRIFEAKMTSNGEVFQKYLANPKTCKITHSKK